MKHNICAANDKGVYHRGFKRFSVNNLQWLGI
jgi:hypothetical protein